MALGSNNSSIFLGISNGKIVRQFKSPTADSKERVNKNGKLVHEEFYDYVEGLITDITTKENEMGKFWVVSINDDGSEYKLEFNYSGGVAGAFLKALPNVNLAEPVRISPKQTIDGDKKKTTVFLNQNGKAAKWYWTKEKPGELPQMKKIKVKGKESWDDSEQLEFLEAYVKTLMENRDQVPQEDF
jgi:hypothetical protein